MKIQYIYRAKSITIILLAKESNVRESSCAGPLLDDFSHAFVVECIALLKVSFFLEDIVVVFKPLVLVVIIIFVVYVVVSIIVLIKVGKFSLSLV